MRIGGVEQKEWAEDKRRRRREPWPGVPSRLWEQAILDQALSRVISLAGEVERLEAEVRRYEAGEGHYRGLDWDDPGRPEFCGNCGEPWPCPTAAALSPHPSERKGP